MRPTFLGFETAKRGLNVSQKGLDIVGHNMMNTSTEGYTRQRVDTYAIGASNYGTRYGNSRTQLAGQGVDMSGVSQVRDSFLDKRFREEYGDVGYYQTTSNIMADIEAAISEFNLNPDVDNPNGTGLKNALKEISSALGSFSSEGDSKTHARILRTTFQNISQLLQQMDQKLDNVAEQSKFDFEVSVEDANGILQKIASLNASIAKDMVATKASNGEYYGPNELLDERNKLLDQLAAYGDMKVEAQPDGTVKVDMNGHNVVDGEKYDMMNVNRNTNGTVSLTWQSSGKNVDLTTGSFKAYLDQINGRGVNAHLTNEVTTNGIRYYKDKLNAFANTLVQVANNIIPVTRVGANGKPEIVRGQYRTLLQANGTTTDAAGNTVPTTNVPVTAANISVSDEWMDSADYVVFEDGSMNSEYLNKLKVALSTDTHVFRATGEIGDGIYSGTFSDFVEDYVVGQAADKNFSDNRLSVTTQIAGDILDQRDEVSGVNQDEEIVNMLNYKKAYQAASRLMTTLDEALDILINSTGRVGL